MKWAQAANKWNLEILYGNLKRLLRRRTGHKSSSSMAIINNPEVRRRYVWVLTFVLCGMDSRTPSFSKSSFGEKIITLSSYETGYDARIIRKWLLANG